MKRRKSQLLALIRRSKFSLPLSLFLTHLHWYQILRMTTDPSPWLLVRCSLISSSAERVSPLSKRTKKKRGKVVEWQKESEKRGFSLAPSRALGKILFWLGALRALLFFPPLPSPLSRLLLFFFQEGLKKRSVSAEVRSPHMTFSKLTGRFPQAFLKQNSGCKCRSESLQFNSLLFTQIRRKKPAGTRSRNSKKTFSLIITYFTGVGALLGHYSCC